MCILPSSDPDFLFSYIFTNIWCDRTSNICCGNGRDVVVHCWLNSHFADYQGG